MWKILLITLTLLNQPAFGLIREFHQQINESDMSDVGSLKFIEQRIYDLLCSRNNEGKKFAQDFLQCQAKAKKECFERTFFKPQFVAQWSFNCAFTGVALAGIALLTNTFFGNAVVTIKD
jgi:hypothetical protein